MTDTTPATVGQLDELARTTKKGFDEVSEQFHAVNGRLDGHDRRFDGIDRRIDAMAQDVGEILSVVKKLVTRREHEALKKKVLALARSR